MIGHTYTNTGTKEFILEARHLKLQHLLLLLTITVRTSIHEVNAHSLSLFHTHTSIHLFTLIDPLNLKLFELRGRRRISLFAPTKSMFDFSYVCAKSIHLLLLQ